MQIDFPEDVALELQPDQLEVLAITGSTATLKYCPLDKAIAQRLLSQIAALKEQYSIGSLEVKIISRRVS